MNNLLSDGLELAQEAMDTPFSGIVRVFVFVFCFVFVLFFFFSSNLFISKFSVNPQNHGRENCFKPCLP